MILLAGLFGAIFVYLLLAMITGNMPERLSKVKEKKQMPQQTTKKG